MYRIRFDPKRGLWVIELSSLFGLVWRAVHKDESLATFENLPAARNYAVALGLGLIYKDQGESLETTIYKAKQGCAQTCPYRT